MNQAMQRELLQIMIAKAQPGMVRPELRTQYGLPHGTDARPDDGEANAALDAAQADWERIKAQQDHHAIPVVMVMKTGAGGYRALWGSKHLDLVPDITGKSPGHDNEWGLVLTGFNKLPGSTDVEVVWDQFLTFRDAVAKTLVNTPLGKLSVTAFNGFVDAGTLTLEDLLHPGDDALELLQEIYAVAMEEGVPERPAADGPVFSVPGPQ